METLPTKQLITGAFLALVKPYSAFGSILENRRVNYKAIVIILFISGWVWNLFRYFTVERISIFTYPLVSFIDFVIMPIFSVGIWFTGTIFFYQIAKNLKKTVSIYQIEIAAFYLWLVWFLAPIFDLPHIIYGVKMATIFGAAAHTSWFFTFTLLPLLSFFLLKDLLKFSKNQLFLAVIISSSLPLIGRFLIENIPLFLNVVLRIYGRPIGYNLTALFTTPVAVVFVIYYWRKIKNLNPNENYMLKASLISAGYCIFTLYLLFVSPFLKIFPAAKTNSVSQNQIGYLGLGHSHHTHSYLFSGSVYSGAAITNPPTGASNDNNDTYWNDTYTGGTIGTLDFDPAKTTIDYIQFTIHIATGTANNQSGPGPKVQGCIRGGTSGTYFCSPWTNNLTTSSGTQLFIINSSSIYTYAVSGDGVACTPVGSPVPKCNAAATMAANWSSLVGALHGTASTPNNNDVIVHYWTQGDNNNTASTGDILSYDSVSLQIHYYTRVTQQTYQWFANANAVQPGSSLAAANTSISTIDRTQVVRLRLSVHVQTGYMDTTTQAFKLQFAAQVSGSCTGSSPVWADVGQVGANELWRGYDNSTPANGANITTSLLDSGADALESYVEANNSPTNPTQLNPTTQTGEWDWVLQNYGAQGSVSYCFRMVNSDGSVFDTYTNYPVITTPVVTQRNITGNVNIKGNVNIR